MINTVATVPANKILLTAHDDDELVYIAKLYDELLLEDAPRAKQLTAANDKFIVCNASSNGACVALPEQYVNAVYPVSKATLDLENKFFHQFETDNTVQTVERVREMRAELRVVYQEMKPFVAQSTQTWIDDEKYLPNFLWHLCFDDKTAPVFDYCASVSQQITD